MRQLMTGRLYAAVIVWACSLLISAPWSIAQLNTATISGSVADQTGAVVPGVSIVIKNTQTGVARELLTNEAGRYSAEALPVGAYEVTASLAGFQTVVRSGIELTVGRTA